MARREVYWADFNPNVPLRTLRDDKPEDIWQALMEGREDQFVDGEDSLAVREAVADAFEALSPRDQFILNARLFEQRPVRSIGETLGISHVHVQRLTKAAIQQLTDTLSAIDRVRERVGMDPTSWDDSAARWVRKIERMMTMAEAIPKTFQVANIRDMLWADVENYMSGSRISQSALRMIDHLAIFGMSRLDDEQIEALPSLLVYKQRRYGCDNILRFGYKGIAIRMSDKVERILQAERRHDLDDEDPYTDLVGYAVIAHMVDDNTFTLPLLEDQS